MSQLELEHLIRSISRLFYEDIHVIILDYFTLLPGKKLVYEHTLAKDLKIQELSMRQALIKLEDDGFLFSRILKKDKSNPEIAEQLKKNEHLSSEKFKIIGWTFHPEIINSIKFRLVALKQYYQNQNLSKETVKFVCRNCGAEFGAIDVLLRKLCKKCDSFEQLQQVIQEVEFNYDESKAEAVKLITELSELLQQVENIKPSSYFYGFENDSDERMLELVQEKEDDSESNNQEAKDSRSRTVWTINNYRNRRSQQMGAVHASIRTVFNYIPRAGGEPMSKIEEREIFKYYRNLSTAKQKTNGIHSQPQFFKVNGQFVEESKISEELLNAMSDQEYTSYYQHQRSDLIYAPF